MNNIDEFLKHISECLDEFAEMVVNHWHWRHRD